MVTFDGNVKLGMQANLQSKCSIDVTLFPFDSQKCKITFTSWMHTSKELVLYALLGDGERTQSVINLENFK